MSCYLITPHIFCVCFLWILFHSFHDVTFFVVVVVVVVSVSMREVLKRVFIASSYHMFVTGKEEKSYLYLMSFCYCFARCSLLLSVTCALLCYCLI